MSSIQKLTLNSMNNDEVKINKSNNHNHIETLIARKYLLIIGTLLLQCTLLISTCLSQDSRDNLRHSRRSYSRFQTLNYPYISKTDQQTYENHNQLAPLAQNNILGRILISPNGQQKQQQSANNLPDQQEVNYMRHSYVTSDSRKAQDELYNQARPGAQIGPGSDNNDPLWDHSVKKSIITGINHQPDDGSSSSSYENDINRNVALNLEQEFLIHRINDGRLLREEPEEDLSVYEHIKPIDLVTAFSKTESSPLSGNCTIKVLQYKATKTDKLGNRCWDKVKIKVCSGTCQTGEFGEWKIPFKRSNHDTCNFEGSRRKSIRLRYCSNEEVSESLRHYRIIEPTRCICKACDSSQSHCLTTSRTMYRG